MFSVRFFVFDWGSSEAPVIFDEFEIATFDFLGRIVLFVGCVPDWLFKINLMGSRAAAAGGVRGEPAKSMRWLGFKLQLEDSGECPVACPLHKNTGETTNNNTTRLVAPRGRRIYSIFRIIKGPSAPWSLH